jgi:hypothetical protein
MIARLHGSATPDVVLLDKSEELEGSPMAYI